MLNVTISTGALMPSSNTMFSGVAGVAARVLGDPCEASEAARVAGVGLIAGLVNTTASPDNELAIDAAGSTNMLAALSNAVTPAEDGDENAAAASEAAAAAARQLMATRLGPSLPEENPVATNATKISYVASRLSPSAERAATGSNSSATAATGGAVFEVPASALSLSGDDPVDTFLLALDFDAHAAAEATDVAAAPRIAGTLSLVLANGTSGDELAVHDLPVPIAFALPLDASGMEDLAGVTCAQQDAPLNTEPLNASAPPANRAVCAFWDVGKNAYSSEGCATLPNPRPPGGSLVWAPGVREGDVRISEANASFLWQFTHDTVLAGCEAVTLVADDNVTRVLGYEQSNVSAATCEAELVSNAARCAWRRDSQSFEGCGCVVAAEMECLCDHATDFTASSAPPKIKPVTVDELLSVSLDDLMRTWKVFAVVGGMFGCMSALVIAFNRRDARAKRKILNKFIDGKTAAMMGFHVVSDVWTWEIDVQEMQFMFSNLHHANDPDAVEALLARRHGDDEEARRRELESVLAQADDFVAADAGRAIQRRREALKRAKRAKEGLPQVQPLGPDGRPAYHEDQQVREVELLIEREAAEADVGVRVRVENGKTRFDTVVDTNRNAHRRENKLEKLDSATKKRLGMKQAPTDSDSETSDSDSETETPVRLDAKAKSPNARAKGLTGNDRYKSFARVRESMSPKQLRKSLRSLTKRKVIPPPPDREMRKLPVVPLNGPVFCGAVGIKYVRFLIAFPIESLARNLVMWKSGDKNQKRYLPFERAVGTAMVYAYLDVKNVVSHVEMGSRIYDAAQLPWVMPTGVTFPLLVAEFKAMCSGNITGDGWMKRSMLWNILALQNPDGSWNVSDSLAAALRAAGEPELAAPIPKLSPRPIVKSFYAAEELVRHCPPALRACVDTLGHGVVDKIWVTLLAMEGCSQAGLVWVLNPWDDVFAEFDILQCGWTYVELRVKGDPQVAAAVLEAERAAKTCITEWREGFVAAATALRAARAAEEARAKKLARAKEKGFIAKACLALWWALTSPVGFVTFWVKYLIGFVKWGLRLYFAAHIFLRAFLANPTDAFSGAERVVMQTTCYLAALIITVWFYYNKATQCCVMLREDIGCSSDVLEACDVVPAGAGCAAFMAQKQLKPAGWSCGAFPDKKNGWHFLTVIAIQIAIMFPVKFTLTRMFTAGGGGVLEPHWRQAVVAAGMNMMEVYAAYLECLFQAFEDPVGVFQKPEIAKIIAQFSAVFKKLLMVTLMTYFMSFVGGIFWLLDRLGIWRRRRKKEARFEDVAVIRARIGAFAGEGADAEDVKLRIEDDHAAAGAAGAAAVAGGVSVERRRMFTKGTPSGAAAAMSDGAAGLAAAGDVAAGFPASTVFGSPAAPKRELPHMRALCGEGDIVARGASVKRSASLDSETSSGSDADKGDSFADEGARGDHEARLRDAVSATRDATAELSRLVFRGDGTYAFATSARVARLADAIAGAMDDAAADAATQADAARAFAVVRAAFVRDGGVAAATAVLRVAARLAFVEEDGEAAFQGDETAPARTRARVAEVLERAAGLLARACEGGRDAATEFRVEGGYAAAAEALCHACVSPRAEADLATALAVTCRGDARAARRAFEAGCFVALRERFRHVSESLARDASEVARLRGDRDARDRAAALCFALAALRTRQLEDGLEPRALLEGGETDRDGRSNTNLGVLLATARSRAVADSKSDIALQYVDLTRVLPPFADHRARHARAAAAALAATAKARPDTALAAERALLAAGAGAAMCELPRGSPGHRAYLELTAALGDAAAARLAADASGGERGIPPPAPRGEDGMPLSPESDDEEEDELPAKGTKIQRGEDPAAETSFSDVSGGVAEDTPSKDASLKTKTVARRRWGAAARAYVARARDDAGDAARAASDAFKTMLAVNTISVDEVRKRRRLYIRKLRWKSVLASYQAWFLASFVWVFGGYVVLVYGVLIYRYLGPGEESAYIAAWGTAFLINTFGIESLKIVGRKMFFLYVITSFKKGFMKAAETLGWYETYTELVGMHLLAEAGAYDGTDFKADNADDGEGDGEGDGDGD